MSPVQLLLINGLGLANILFHAQCADQSDGKKTYRKDVSVIVVPVSVPEISCENRADQAADGVTGMQQAEIYAVVLFAEFAGYD